MKKDTFFSVIVSLLLMVCGLAFGQEVQTSGDFEFTVSGEGAQRSATITAYTGSSKEVLIPRQLGGVNVTAIGRGAFAENEEIERVVIPNGVTKIGAFAFFDTPNLKQVIIPSSVTECGPSAFAFNGAAYDSGNTAFRDELVRRFGSASIRYQ